MRSVSKEEGKEELVEGLGADMRGLIEGAEVQDLYMTLLNMHLS